MSTLFDDWLLKAEADQKAEKAAARPGETIHVYRRVGEPMNIHLNTGGKPGGGFFVKAYYEYWRGHAPTEYLDRSRVWRTWARLHSYTPNPPPDYNPRPPLPAPKKILCTTPDLW